jgi:adenosine kinase
LIERSDYLFGNEDVFAELAKVMDIDPNVKTNDPHSYMRLCKQLHSRYHSNKKKPSHIIVTRGSKSVIVSNSMEKNPIEIKVPKVELSLIKDTNGAGDSFVGGFLSQIAIGHEVSQGVRAGMYCSKLVL